MPRLWSRGGFPRSFLADTDVDSVAWRKAFLRTFIERDLPQYGADLGAPALHRFLAMLAHYHGQILNVPSWRQPSMSPRPPCGDMWTCWRTCS